MAQEEQINFTPEELEELMEENGLPEGERKVLRYILLTQLPQHISTRDLATKLGMTLFDVEAALHGLAQKYPEAIVNPYDVGPGVN